MPMATAAAHATNAMAQRNLRLSDRDMIQSGDYDRTRNILRRLRCSPPSMRPGTVDSYVPCLHRFAARAEHTHIVHWVQSPAFVFSGSEKPLRVTVCLGRMKARWVSFVVLGLVGGCAVSPPSATRDDGASERRLQQARAKHADLQERLSGAPAEDVATCKMTADDCTLQVAEARGRLASTYGLVCDDRPDADSKSACVTSLLEGHGHSRELAEYFALENWCVSKLLTCTAELASKTQQAEGQKRFTQRQQLLESAPASQAARNAAAAQRAQIDYLQSSLPPEASALCPAPADPDACQQRATNEAKRLEERLRQEPYDAAAAVTAYEALKRLEASCEKPELECLLGALPRYGVFPESRKWVERNLSLLTERQTLAAGAAAQETACIRDLQAQHQAEIVAAYVPYAREPVLYFRTQLDKAFLKLHQAQVSCLTAGRKASPVVAADI
jgi:hypothetical protein